jgi:mRNA-degrading endonuclease toxin of MazEF toxin-antitoxin module
VRRRGEVYWYEFEAPIMSHMVVLVSRDTGRNAILAAQITSAPQPAAADVIPVAGMDCSRLVKGYVRCDRLTYILKDDRYWGNYVTSMSDADMGKIAAGLRATLDI